MVHTFQIMFIIVFKVYTKIKKTPNLKKVLQQLKTVSDISNKNVHAFEEYVCDIFKKSLYNVNKMFT